MIYISDEYFQKKNIDQNITIFKQLGTLFCAPVDCNQHAMTVLFEYSGYRTHMHVNMFLYSEKQLKDSARPEDLQFYHCVSLSVCLSVRGQLLKMLMTLEPCGIFFKFCILMHINIL